MRSIHQSIAVPSQLHVALKTILAQTLRLQSVLPLAVYQAMLAQLVTQSHAVAEQGRAALNPQEIVLSSIKHLVMLLAASTWERAVTAIQSHASQLVRVVFPVAIALDLSHQMTATLLRELSKEMTLHATLQIARNQWVHAALHRGALI